MFFSFFKKKSQKKDRKYFLGHGGVLDRLRHFLGLPFGFYLNYIFKMNKLISILGSTNCITTLNVIDKKKIFKPYIFV